MTEYRIGIDVGGTFTDVVGLKDGQLVRKKLRSTPHDFSEAISEGLTLLLQGADASGKNVREVIHGTTIVTNALIEKKGARTGLITTKGFRDILEIGRLRTPRLYDLTWRKPVPLVPRELRREVDERLTTEGDIFRELDEKSVHEAVEFLAQRGINSIAICLINSFANGNHETRVAEIIQESNPDMSLSISHEVLPEMREYERTSTTVVNAYVRPIVDTYISSMEKKLQEMGVDAPLQIMQSSGGTMSAATSREKPIFMVESGPAAGVMGCLHLGRKLGHKEIISFDMGGTTAKAGTIQDGGADYSSEYEVGGELHMGHHLLRGGGYMLRVPSIGIAEVGAGGGSILWIDDGGVLQVGPQSAGADPGPACYGAGGDLATITDANLALGYLNPEQLVGGELSIDPKAAKIAIEKHIAGPLKMDLTEAAYGAYLVANSRMIRAVRAVTSERGRNPAEFVMYAFGGGGPAHALSIAADLDITQVVIPPAPGLFSALGLLFTDVEHQYVQTLWRDVPNGIDASEVNNTMQGMRQDALTMLDEEGFTEDQVKLRWQADMRYHGQQYELLVGIPSEELTSGDINDLVESFHSEHLRTFGYRSEEQVQLVNIRLSARGLPNEPRMPDRLALSDRLTAQKSRQAYFGPSEGWIETTIVGRAKLAEKPMEGPIIMEEYDATTVIPPGAKAHTDDWGNVIIERER